jgi:hypothetical protein
LVSICISIGNFKIYSSYINWFVLLLVPLIIVARIPCDSLLIDYDLFLCPDGLRVDKEELSLIVHLVSEVGHKSQQSNGDASNDGSLCRKDLDGFFELGLLGILEGSGCIIRGGCDIVRLI